MKIGIIGSRGIPNRYGGFEQFAEHLAVGLSQKGLEVSVYCSHNHPYQKKTYKGVKLIKCYDPEDKIGIAGQFIYDLNCILDSHKRDFDIIYQLGYTSNGIWQWLLPGTSVILTNMDGIEWQRSKYSPIIRTFLRYSEKLAALRSHLLIADSPVISEYLKKKYQIPIKYITYGAKPVKETSKTKLYDLGLKPNQYFLIVARLQPDNHIEEVIQGILLSESHNPLIIVGNHDSRYGNYLKKKYTDARIRFLGGVFDQLTLDSLRKYSKLYFHGHSAGGTNPSLLEAMAAGAKICAHDNAFNRSVLKRNALYFSNSESVCEIISNNSKRDWLWEQSIENNLNKIRENHNWEAIIYNYFELFHKLDKS